MNRPTPKLVRVQRPARLCLFPHCKAQMEPGHWMCETHWAMVPGPERRALMAEVTRLRELGQKRPSADLIELAALVRRAAALTKAKSAAAATVIDALDLPLQSQQLKDDLNQVVEED